MKKKEAEIVAVKFATEEGLQYVKVSFTAIISRERLDQIRKSMPNFAKSVNGDVWNVRFETDPLMLPGGFSVWVECETGRAFIPQPGI